MPTSLSFWELPIATIEQALHIRKQIEALRAEEAAIMGGGSTVGTPAKRRGRPPKADAVPSTVVKMDGRKGKRSKAARDKMAAAQKARWATKRGESTPAPVEAAAKSTRKRRTMSLEARAKIAAAQRARWAKTKRS